MTDEDISKLTLGELERIAERFGKAVADIRAAQSLLGPSHIVMPTTDGEVGEEPGSIVVAEDPAAAHRRRQFQPVEAQQPRALRGKTTHPGGGLSAAERAERNRILGRAAGPVDPNLPDDIAALEKGE